MLQSVSEQDSISPSLAHPGRIPEGLAQAKAIIAFASAKGGTGKSTLAANLAVALALKGRKVGLLDADLKAPSLGAMLGIARLSAFESGGRIDAAGGPLGIRMVGIDPDQTGAPTSFLDEPVSTNGNESRSEPALSCEQLVEKASFGALDLLMIDLPPGFSHAVALGRQIPSLGVVLVLTSSAAAVAAARRALHQSRESGPPVLALIENMQSFYCGGCNSVRPLLPNSDVAALAREFGAPVIGRLPFDSRLAECGDSGRLFLREYPDAPLAKLLAEVAQNLLAIACAPVDRGPAPAAED